MPLSEAVKITFECEDSLRESEEELVAEAYRNFEHKEKLAMGWPTN